MRKVRTQAYKDMQELKAKHRLVKNIERAYKKVLRSVVYFLTKEEAAILRKIPAFINLDVRLAVKSYKKEYRNAVARLR